MKANRNPMLHMHIKIMLFMFFIAYAAYAVQSYSEQAGYTHYCTDALSCWNMGAL